MIKPKTSFTKLLKFIRWSITGFITLLSLDLLAAGDVLAAVLMFGSAFLSSSLAHPRLYSKLKWQVPTWGKMAIFAVLFFTSFAFASPPVAKEDSVTEVTQVELETEPELEPESTIEPKQALFAVTSITDGDTIKVLIEGKAETIRLANINTPETVDPRRPAECMGQVASAKMKELVSGQQVSLLSDSTQSDRDRYYRLLRFVFLEDGADVGLEMIKLGYAQSSPYGKSPHQYLEQYEAAQAAAKEQQLGLWNETACPTPTSTPKPTTTTTAPTEPASGRGAYTCDCKKTCTQMSSCDEAQYQLNACGCKARDGDGDGIACDSQCQ